MESALFPANEEKRLAELLSFEILDTEPEVVFDQFTQLASQICQTPIALISLIDQDRQWFKSRVGLDADQTHRNLAFCAHAILKDEIFEVEDASKDKRFCDNPLVTDAPNIRFYAGTPLISSRGYALGTLCAIDDKPKKLTASQRAALTTLGNAVIAQLELKRKTRELERVNEFKKHFMSYVSHEVRTPLNAIAMFSRDLLNDVRMSRLPDHYSTRLKHIQTSGMRLLEIVDTVLDVKQVEKGQLKLLPRPVETQLYLSSFFSLLNAINESAAHFEWQVKGALPHIITIDDTKLSQVATTLINHCLHQSPALESLEATAKIEHQQLNLTLHGASTMLSAEEIIYLNADQISFDESFYVDSNCIDLSIAKNLISVLKGALSIEETASGRLTITLSVPLNISAVEPSCEATSKNTPETLHIRDNVSLLVVEDNEINQIVIASLLEEMNINFFLVETGEQAVEMLFLHDVDLIIMDIGLPGISGVEATQIIKNAHPDMPVIALTADVVTDREELLSSGLDAVLTKPIALNHLVRMLNLYLGNP